MSDPFARMFDNLAGEHRKVSAVDMQRDRAISAYRQNIALPDVWIADRDAAYEAKVVGEDGNEMTLERRQELMRGTKPCIDETGRLRKDVDYRTEEWDIGTERLGDSAVKNRPGIRMATFKETIEFVPGKDVAPS